MHEQELEIPAGRMRVLADDRLIRARGIRYGTCERFGLPEPVRPWSGVVDATRPGPAAPQPDSALEAVTGPVADAMPKVEDPLFLSVTAPVGARDLPVMVWFHGGSYVTGAGEAPKYDPARLAAEGDVVVVAVTARLGLFGYIAPTGTGPRNLGLRDQMLALGWVRDQIAAFGGDPSCITLFGQSAGADTILDLCLVPELEGWFDRVILQSAPLPLRGGRAALNAEMQARIDAAIGDAPGAPSTAELARLQLELVAVAARYGNTGSVPFGPMLGEDPLPAEEELRAAYASAARRIELLVGACQEDARPFVVFHPWASRLRWFGRPGLAIQRRIGAFVTRQLFTGPSVALAEQWRRDGGRATSYRLDWAPEGAPLGCCHCMDLPLLLGEPEEWRDALMLGGQPPDEALGREMRAAWAAFAHDGTAALGADHLTFS